MKNLIDSWRANGDSVGGVFEIVVTGLPVGLGSHIHWDLKLESKLAAQLMGIQAIKGVEIGSGFKGAGLPGSKAHDEIYYDLKKGFYRSSNQAGGIEGGMTNGEELIIRLAMKPIPTLAKALHSADIISKKGRTAAKERSDVCAVPAASIVGEAVTAIVLAQSTADKFGGDSIKEIKRNYNSYLEQLKKF
jgi:chorismate synthase